MEQTPGPPVVTLEAENTKLKKKTTKDKSGGAESADPEKKKKKKKKKAEDVAGQVGQLGLDD